MSASGRRWIAGTAALAGGVAIVAALWLALAGDDSDRDPAAAQASTPTSPPSPAATPTPVVTFAVSCPEPVPPGTRLASPSSVLGWQDFVRFEGITYDVGGELWIGGPPRPDQEERVPASLIGAPFARVSRKLAEYEESSSHTPQDCEAAFLEPGTILYTVNGYDPRFRIALASGKLYEAMRAEGVRTAGDFIDIRGKVTAIEFRDEYRDDEVLGRIDDPAEVARLVDLFLASEYNERHQPDPPSHEPLAVELVFLLADGTEFARPYSPDVGLVIVGIVPPAEFNNAVNAVLGR